MEANLVASKYSGEVVAGSSYVLMRCKILSDGNWKFEELHLSFAKGSEESSTLNLSMSPHDVSK